jgi:hypothetical protein
MIQKAELVTVLTDITWAKQLHGKVGTVTQVWPEGESWTYAVDFPNEGEVFMYHWELDRVPAAR